MSWLQTLLLDPNSVAHIVLLYALVISVGVLLGKIKIFGISLGVTFVLFAGILDTLAELMAARRARAGQ